MKYKRIETANGRVQYWMTVNGKYKMVSKEKFPDGLANRLEPGEEVEIESPEATQTSDPVIAIKPGDRKCFIDGEPGKFKKFLELQTVYLCEEHQHSLTTGEVVYEMRKAGLLE